jgi:hypothetical protein
VLAHITHELDCLQRREPIDIVFDDRAVLSRGIDEALQLASNGLRVRGDLFQRQ